MSVCKSALCACRSGSLQPRSGSSRVGGGGGLSGPSFKTLGVGRLNRGRVAEWPVTDPILPGLVQSQGDGQVVIPMASGESEQAPAVLTGPGQRLSLHHPGALGATPPRQGGEQ